MVKISSLIAYFCTYIDTVLDDLSQYEEVNSVNIFFLSFYLPEDKEISSDGCWQEIALLSLDHFQSLVDLLLAVLEQVAPSTVFH